MQQQYVEIQLHDTHTFSHIVDAALYSCVINEIKHFLLGVLRLLLSVIRQ